MTFKKSAAAGLSIILAMANTSQVVGAESSGVTAQRIIGADREPGAWLTTGRTYDEQRFSPLAQISSANVGELGLTWYSDIDTDRGQEATPLMIDGRLIVSTAWSMVKAFDATTGKPLWSFDPEVPRETLVKACCDAVNRGVAAWGGMVFVGTLDGQLVAIDAATGRKLWSQLTVDQSKSYTITGAPRVIDGKVIIGNGGAEYGVRGYVTAYDAATGKQLWRFYTVPGDPKTGPEPAYLQKAAKTWNGEWWKLGGGGTVWDAMAYDPELDLLYIGVGNGSPWNQAYRSPGGGDNLYISSIVALRPKTGAYVWHYQTTPGDSWDYTATQHIVLADLKIAGRMRKVLMQAPKNGFFYVLDRTTGELLSAKNFVPQNWTTGVDMKTGRPIENPQARYYRSNTAWVQTPGPIGGHSWQPMSFSRQTGLVYIPANGTTFIFAAQKDWKSAPLGYNLGVYFGPGGPAPAPKALAAAQPGFGGQLIAWDPVAAKPRWTIPYPIPGNGGLLSTAGNLVFQGTSTGEFIAYAADTGRKLWSTPARTGIVAAPISYSIGRDQYVAVMAGWGGLMGRGAQPGGTTGRPPNLSRVLVFKLGGKVQLPPVSAPEPSALDAGAAEGSGSQIAEGAYLYGRYCAACHGFDAVSGGLAPDLRNSALPTDGDAWREVLLRGALKEQGMVSFASVLTETQSDAVRLYVLSRANKVRKAAR